MGKQIHTIIMENIMDNPQKAKENYHISWQPYFWIYAQRKGNQQLNALCIPHAHYSIIHYSKQSRCTTNLIIPQEMNKENMICTYTHTTMIYYFFIKKGIPSYATTWMNYGGCYAKYKSSIEIQIMHDLA